MNYYMQKDGRRVLAELLAGGSGKINGMYVEYGPQAADSGPRTLEGFEALPKDGSAGYARVPVEAVYVDDNLNVHFDALLRTDDFSPVPDKPVALRCATLAVLARDRSDDKLVCTVAFNNDVPLVPGAYVTVRTKLNIGV